MSATPEKAKRSRWDDAKALKKEPFLPEVGADVEHLIEYLFIVGPTTGDGPLLPSEIRAWQEGTGVDLDEFAFSSLMSLSREYLGTMHQARDPQFPAPCAAPINPAEATQKLLARRQQQKAKKT